MELQGRGPIIYFERGPFSDAVGTIYSPVCMYGPKNANRNRKLWNWVQRIKTEIPARTPLIIGTDANGHVGTSARDVMSIDDDIEALPAIGPHGASKENAHGTILREFLEATNMVAANTHIESESGYTWTGAKSLRNRVDFILMDSNLRHSVGKTESDHVPIKWIF